LAKLNAYIYGSQAFAKLFEQPRNSLLLFINMVFKNPLIHFRILQTQYH